MQAAEQWSEIEKHLPEGWEEARLSFTVEDAKAVAGAAEVLAPLSPGRAGSELRFHVHSSGPAGVESVRNLVRRLDRRRLWGALVLVDVRVPDRALAEEHGPVRGLVASWEDALLVLPPDWSDLLCELELDSTDYLPRAALLGSPLNPTRVPESIALRFRVSRKGYGAAPGMTRRCLERMEADAITGRLSVVNALSQVDYVATQGPVWRIGGRAV